MTNNKILHTGDIHLGMTYGNRGYSEGVRNELVNARFETLSGLVERANRENCGLFLVAGDLFHRTNVPRQTILRALEILTGFEGNCVAVLPGNHDYGDEYSSLWKTFRETAPDNILLLDQTIPYDLREFNLEITLYPAPCNSKHSGNNRLGWIRELGERPAGVVHLGVAHGSVKGISPDFDERYFPMEADELVELGLHHWCLGHTHVPYPERDLLGESHFTYCGTPEADGFDCRHGGFARITQLDEQNNFKSRLITTGRFNFAELHREVNGLDDLLELEREIANKGENTLMKLTLDGTLPRDEYEKRWEILERIRDRLTYLELDETSLSVEITKQTIAEEFASESFPFLLLTRLEAKGETEALQAAYQMIKKVRK